MTQDQTVKLQTLQQVDPFVVFRWRHRDRKVDGYVGLTNLRLELVMCGLGHVKYVQAAPVMAIKETLPTVIMQANNLMTISSGPRKNIVVQLSKVKPEETAHPTTHTGVQEIDNSTPDSLVAKVFEMTSSPAFPGTDMREPAYARLTNKPATVTPNYTAELKALIGAKAEDSADTLKSKFVEKLSRFSTRTSTGWTIPFNYVFAGGMIVAEGEQITATGKQATYIRNYDWFINWCSIHNWKVGSLEA